MRLEIFGARISRKFVKQIFENYPEASTGSIQCVDFDYGRGVRGPLYTFEIEAGRKTLTRKIGFHDMVSGLRLFMQAKARGELAGCPWKREGRGRSFAADYDRETVDAICQFALFGEIRYN